MADIFTQSSAYHGTFLSGSIHVDAHYQVCAIANISASNNFECTFWILENGERVDSNLGTGSFVVRDKTGAAVPGVSGSSITPDVNGYYHSTPVSALAIIDLNHYLLEIDLSIDGVSKTASIGLVVGD